MTRRICANCSQGIAAPDHTICEGCLRASYLRFLMANDAKPSSRLQDPPKPSGAFLAPVVALAVIVGLLVLLAVTR